MGISPQIEKPARTMLGHAMRGELDDLAVLIHATGDTAFRQVIALCLLASGYVAVDVCGRWPLDADVRRIAVNLAETEPVLSLDEQDVHAYLSRVVLHGSGHLPGLPLTAATTWGLTLTWGLILNLILFLGGGVELLFLTSSSEALAEGDEVRNV